MANSISNLSRDYQSIRKDIIDYAKEHYSNLSDSFGDDSSITSFIVDLLSDSVDSLNYHIDRAFQNTQVETATSRSALMNMARINGLKVPGPKAGTCEVRFSCLLPAGYTVNGNTDMSLPNWNAAPVILRNCVVGAGNLSYTIDENVDFSEQFNSNAYSNRTYSARRDANGNITGYLVTKSVMATAGTRKVFKKVLTTNDVSPFMEVILPDTDVMNVESVIFKASPNINTSPDISEYYVDEEEFTFGEGSVPTYRYFEVESLADQWRWGSMMSGIDNRVVSDMYDPEAYVDYVEFKSGMVSFRFEVEDIVLNAKYESVTLSYGDYFELTGQNVPIACIIPVREDGTRAVNVTAMYGGRKYDTEQEAILAIPEELRAPAMDIMFRLTGHTDYEYRHLILSDEFSTDPGDWNSYSASDAGYDKQINPENYAGIYKYTPREGTNPTMNEILVSMVEGDYEGAVKVANTTEPVTRFYRGKWKPIRQKYTTEFTDNGYMKITFGAGNEYKEFPDGETTYAKYRMSSIMNNDMLGVLPKVGWTMYVLYSIGGGVETNVAAGAINTIKTMQADFPHATESSDVTTDVRSRVLRSMAVTNTTSSITGKDAPTNEDVKKLIKYNSASQQRCVTLKDYKLRAMMMPPKYGSPFRCSVTEENNKVVISMLGISAAGVLQKAIPSTLADNLEEYLSHYKPIGDYVEIKSGKVYNVGFLVDVFIDKAYNSSDVISSIISTIRDYMDVNKHDMGEDIFVGSLNKDISMLDGVISLIDVSVYKISGGGYSTDKCPLPSIEDTSESSCIKQDTYQFLVEGAVAEKIDLDATDSVLVGDNESMYEVRNPIYDIRVRAKQR